MASYTSEFKEEAVRKVLLSKSHTSIFELSKSIGVSSATLRQWVKRHHDVILVNAQISETEQIDAVLKTMNLSADERSIYCRQHGLLPEELESWELEMKKNLATPNVEKSEYLKLQKETEALKQKLAATNKELLRKDKALAEAAALLLLQKKVQALLGGEDESTNSGSGSNY